MVALSKRYCWSSSSDIGFQPQIFSWRWFHSGHEHTNDRNSSFFVKPEHYSWHFHQGFGGGFQSAVAVFQDTCCGRLCVGRRPWTDVCTDLSFILNEVRDPHSGHESWRWIRVSWNFITFLLNPALFTPRTNYENNYISD